MTGPYPMLEQEDETFSTRYSGPPFVATELPPDPALPLAGS
jgi:hypothetical protein